MDSYDAIIIGSGPNGFAAAITLQKQGLRTLLIEGADTVGGGMRSKELTLPGFIHDVCSAIHPLAFGSPWMKKLPLEDYGLQFTHAPYPVAQPLANGDAVLLHQDLALMAEELGVDFSAYKTLLQPFLKDWGALSADILGPLRIPKSPFLMAKFGLQGLRPAASVASRFKTARGKALWAGLVAHGMQPFSKMTTSAMGMVLALLGHRFGWPIPIGGSQAIANALLAYYRSLGGEVQLNTWVTDIRELPNHKLLFLDMTPQQVLELEGIDLDPKYRKQLANYRYGMGVFKVDWALSEPTVFRDGRSHLASTVHVGNSYQEIAEAELATYNGKLVDRPFVLFSQPSRFDPSRAPGGKHVGWAYCHVPHGSRADRTDAIEEQIERFAPGFRESILARHRMGPGQLQDYNPNYIGGDINGGQLDIFQLFTRPTRSLTPYRTSNPTVYLASSSTPPGGGVHGMCGFHAARVALRDHYQLNITP